MDSRSASLRARKRAARRKSEHLQTLRLQVKETCKHGSRSDSALTNDVSFCLVPCDRWNFKQDEKAKTFAKLTHLGRALMRPRWRNFDERKAPTVIRDRRDAREAPEGTAGLTFFGTFFVQRQRKYIKSRYSERVVRARLRSREEFS